MRKALDLKAKHKTVPWYIRTWGMEAGELEGQERPGIHETCLKRGEKKGSQNMTLCVV